MRFRKFLILILDIKKTAKLRRSRDYQGSPPPQNLVLHNLNVVLSMQNKEVQINLGFDININQIQCLILILFFVRRGKILPPMTISTVAIWKMGLAGVMGLCKS